MNLGLDLTPQQQALTDRFAALAREKFAPRAAHYDGRPRFLPRTSTTLPAGLHAPTVPEGTRRSRPRPIRGDALRSG